MESAVQSLELQVRTGFRVQGSGFRVQGSGFRVQGSGFRVQGAQFRACEDRVQGSGFRAQGSWCIPWGHTKAYTLTPELDVSTLIHTRTRIINLNPGLKVLHPKYTPRIP